MELKTLKDLKFAVVFSEDDSVDLEVSDLLVKKELKAEAIKWVKSQDNIFIYKNPALIEWIMYFFNISEEDLK